MRNEDWYDRNINAPCFWEYFQAEFTGMVMFDSNMERING